MQMAETSLSDREYRQAFPAEYMEETSLGKDVIDDPGVLSDSQEKDVTDDPKESRGGTAHTPEDLERMVQEE